MKTGTIDSPWRYDAAADLATAICCGFIPTGGDRSPTNSWPPSVSEARDG
jgi:hypothetical protein